MLQIQNISKNYDNAPLLRDISFNIADGEIVCLLGPSGTGKTTLLRIIAGLEEADAGQIVFDGKDLRKIPPHERGFGMMFQDLALFPHKNVFQNVAFGLRMQNVSHNEITKRVNEALELVGLDANKFAARDVNNLSGGEQQRVALARTLAPRPRLVMFDEPLGALDRILRQDLVNELRVLLKRLRMTALYVTHDQDEAFALADRLIILNAGQIQQAAAPPEIYQQPANAFVARFMGLTNLIKIETLERRDSAARAKTDAGVFAIAKERASSESRFVLLRPRALERISESSNGTENVLHGKIVETMWRAGHQQIVLQVRGSEFIFEWDGGIELNRERFFELDAHAIQFLPNGENQ